MATRPHRVLVLAAAVGLALVAPASADGGGRRGSTVVRAAPHAVKPAPSVFPRPVDPWRFWPPGSRLHHRAPPFHHVTAPLVVPTVVSSVVVIGGYSSGVGIDPGVAYAPAFQAPPPTVGGSLQTVLPTPTIIEYPTGWYQLRGDGVSAPYVWVWIPRAPAPPPAVAPPAPPGGPPAPPSTAPLEPEPRLSPPRSLYRWNDGDGVAHWTDRLENVPERYRAEVQRRP